MVEAGLGNTKEIVFPTISCSGTCNLEATQISLFCGTWIERLTPTWPILLQTKVSEDVVRLQSSLEFSGAFPQSTSLCSLYISNHFSNFSCFLPFYLEGLFVSLLRYLISFGVL
jgi:hypothetical protein